MKLHIAGGCGEHGRNCFHVIGEHTAFLVDCGQMAGEPGGGYPRLSADDIAGIRCVFLTHSHADHTGALPWLRQQGYSGPVLASQHTLDQLPFSVKNGFALEDICPRGEGSFLGIRIHWGRTGHCVGSVWYQFDVEERSLLFSGDYTEDTRVFACDPLREKRADLAILDCAYGRNASTYAACCEKMLKRVRQLQETYPLLVFPIPKFGRGTEILRLFLDSSMVGPYYGDAHFCKELAKSDAYAPWYKPGTHISSEVVLPYTGMEKIGIVFLSNPQLRTEYTRTLAQKALTHGGFAVMTGTAEQGTFSAELLEQGSMEMIRYPVHLGYSQYQQLISKNAFSKTIPYHSVDFNSETIIYF